MNKNFLASRVGLRKETATLTSLTYATDNVIAEGLVVQLADERYGVVFDEKDVTGKDSVVVGVVTAGHVLNDKVDFGGLTKATVIEAAVNQVYSLKITSQQSIQRMMMEKWKIM